jgi:glycosyltransferase involved in cell wall biosynthesis
VFGQPDLARAAILSACRYLGTVEEIRVVDDKPADPLVDHHPDVLWMSDRIKYEVNPINMGRTRTYNKLLQECTTDLFLMLDGDDYLADEVDFGEFIRQFEADSGLVLACGRCCEVFGDRVLKTSIPTMRGRLAGFEYFQAWVGVENLFPHSACIVKRDTAISCCGYPSDILNSDIAMLRSVLLEGDTIVIDTLMSYWRFHGSNASKNAELKVLLQNFDCILIPYRRGMARNLPLTRWLIQNTRSYLVSAFHQIVGDGGRRGLWRYIWFHVCLIRLLRRESTLALIGSLTSLPKVAALILLYQVLGHKRFARMMALRGNYVYISKRTD